LTESVVVLLVVEKQRSSTSGRDPRSPIPCGTIAGELKHPVGRADLLR